MNAYRTIRVDARDGIVTVTLDRPDKRNAIDAQMNGELHGLLGELRYDESVRVLILTGTGTAFCAGADMHERSADPREDERLRALSDQWRNEYLRLFPAPTIAMVNGFCFGGGFSLVCVCDIAMTADDAVFALSEIDVGRIPGGMLAKNLSETLRGRELLYYAMTGERFDGRRAAEIGLVNRAVPRAELNDAVQALANTLAQKDPVALRMCKELYKTGARMSYEETYAFASAKAAQTEYLQRRQRE